MKLEYRKNRAFIYSLSLSLTIAVGALTASVALTTAGAAAAAELTADQKQEVKLKSAKWGELRQKALTLSKGSKDDKQKAIEIYESILAERQALSLDLAAEYALLGELYTQMGREEEANTTFKKMLANREALDGADDPQVIYALEEHAKSLEHFGKKAEAAKLRARVAAIHKEEQTMPVFGKVPPTVIARTKEAEDCRAKGERLMKSDNQGKAYLYFNRAVLLCPDDPVHLRNRAEAESWTNKFNNAMGDLNKAIKIKPDFARAYVDRAFTFENLQKYPLAIADFEKAISLNPKDTESMGSRAKLLDNMGRHKEAVEGYTQVIKTDPSLYWPYIQRAIAYVSLKQFEEAIADSTVLVDRSPTDTDYYENRAGIYVKAGHLHKALDDYKKILELEPRHTYAKEKIAQVEKLIGNVKAAPAVKGVDKKNSQ